MGGGLVRVVIPMKPLKVSKGRLAAALDARRRTLLSLWMLGRVLQAARACREVGEVAVTGGDAAVLALCAEFGASWTPDAAGELNGALETARKETFDGQWAAMLFLAGDLPTLTCEEVAGLVDSGAGRHLVLAPALRGGTNAILVPSGLAFRFQLGTDSFRRHCLHAASLTHEWRTFRSAGVEADVDVPADLARLEQAQPTVWHLAAGMERFVARGQGSSPRPPGLAIGTAGQLPARAGESAAPPGVEMRLW